MFLITKHVVVRVLVDGVHVHTRVGATHYGRKRRLVLHERLEVVGGMVGDELAVAVQHVLDGVMDLRWTGQRRRFTVAGEDGRRKKGQGQGEDQEADFHVAPSVSLNELEADISSQATSAGKRALVNFWGTWCSPRLQEMPALERLHKRMAGRPFAILAVDPKQPEPDVARFVRALGITFTVLLDPTGKTAADWGIKIYPTTYLVDADGRIRYRSVGPRTGQLPEPGTRSAIHAGPQTGGDPGEPWALSG